MFLFLVPCRCISRVPTFPDWQNSRISPNFSIEFQYIFSLFLKWLPSSFESKSARFICNSKSKSFLSSLFRQFRGLETKQKKNVKHSRSVHCFPSFISFSRILIKKHKIPRFSRFSRALSFFKVSQVKWQPRNFKILLARGFWLYRIIQELKDYWTGKKGKLRQ